MEGVGGLGYIEAFRRALEGIHPMLLFFSFFFFEAFID